MSTQEKTEPVKTWEHRGYIALYRDRTPDWHAFADAQTEGFRRAQHRFIGSGASGKGDPMAIPPGNFTLSIMYVPVGQGNAPHSHEVEEVFFVLRGHLRVFWDDAEGQHHETRLGPWDCALAPPDVVHGFHNDGLEPCYLQVMLGKAAPDLMTYADASLQQQRDAHLKPPGG